MVVSAVVTQVILAIGLCYALSLFSVEGLREKDLVSELRQQMADIQEKQRIHENEMMRQRTTSTRQAVEISKLKSLLHALMSQNTHNSNCGNSSHTQVTNEERKGKIVKHGVGDNILDNSKSVHEHPTTKEKMKSEADHILSDEKVQNPLQRTDVGGKGGLKQVRKRQTAAVAFSVYLDHDVVIGANQVLKFNKIITNDGNGYSVHTGAFTCPEAGMYLLTFFIGQRSNKFYISLKINSVNVIDAASESYHVPQDLQGGNSIIVRRKTGDVVLIENGYPTQDHIEGSPDLRLTSFSGVLLYQ